MKSILAAIVLMFCLATNRSYAGETVVYNYGYGQTPVVVNTHISQTVWMPVIPAPQPQIVYYPSYVWGFIPTVSYSSPISYEKRCFLLQPRTYYLNSNTFYLYR